MDINCTTEEILDMTLVVIRNPNNFQMDINFTTAEITEYDRWQMDINCATEEILNMIDGKWISVTQRKRY